jgi:hypothetical protein
MLGFLVESIYVIFGDQFFQQFFDIPMGIYRASLLADLFLYPYKAEYIQNLQDEKKLAVFFNDT